MIAQSRLAAGALAVIGLVSACFVIAYTAQVHSSYGGSSVSPQAFTVTQRVIHFSGRDSEVREESSANRADGSYARTFTVRSPAGEIGRALEVVDLAGRTATVAEPFTKSRVTMHLSEAEVRERRGAARSGCLGIELDRAQRSRILGNEVALAIRKSKTETIEIFVASALNCFPLRKTFNSTSGGRTETTTRTIDLGEPPDSAFQPPSDFVERSPAEVQAAYRARFGARGLWSGEMLQKLEERYWNHQAK